MSLSGIVLFGLPHKVSIINFNGDEDDGAGGIILGGELTVYLNRKCRITTVDGEDALTSAGYNSEERWKVILEYSPNITKRMIIRVSASTPAASMCGAGDFRILWVKQQIDHLGGFHHTSLIMEAS